MSELWSAVDPADKRLQRGLELMMKARGRAIEAGQRPVGWKIGWNTAAVREHLGVSSSVIGFILESGVHQAGESVSLAGAVRPGAEVELALYAGADGDLAAVGPGVEIVDPSGDFGDVEASLAANIWHRGGAVGDRSEWSPELLDEIEVRVELGGKPAGEPVRPRDVIGDPEDVIRFVAATAQSLGEELREGDLILSGLLLPTPVWLEPGDRLGTDFGPLGRLDVEFVD